MKLYDELFSWWPLMSSPADYAEEAALYERLLTQHCRREARTLLELGSGGGNNASYLKSRFEMTLVDLSNGMLAVSRALNPECEHVQGDLRSVRLGRLFDCVFLHDAVCYMRTEEELRQAIETAFVHCAPGGAAVFAPDHVRETFHSSTDCGGEDDGARGMRYLEWSWDPDPTDSTYLVDYVYALREADGHLRTVHDRHVEGLFAREDWIRLLNGAGFEPVVVPFDHSELEPGTYEVFACRKPTQPGGVIP